MERHPLYAPAAVCLQARPQGRVELRVEKKLSSLESSRAQLADKALVRVPCLSSASCFSKWRCSPSPTPLVRSLASCVFLSRTPSLLHSSVFLFVSCQLLVGRLFGQCVAGFQLLVSSRLPRSGRAACLLIVQWSMVIGCCCDCCGFKDASIPCRTQPIERL
jgi:hypothetical protein